MDFKADNLKLITEDHYHAIFFAALRDIYSAI